MMKIVLSAYACRPNEGTEMGNGWNWAYQLSQQGNEVWCITSVRNKKAIVAYLQENELPGLHFVFVELPTAIEQLRKKYHAVFVYLHYLYWQKEVYRHAKRLHEEVSFDIAHHVTYGSLQMSSKLWKLQIPFILGPVGGGQFAPAAFKKYLGKSWFVEKLRYYFSNSVLLNLFQTKQALQSPYTLVLTNNQETYEMAIKLGARQVRMGIDTGLPASFYPPQFPEREPSRALKVLWVGSMRPRKGLELLLDIFAAVPENISLTIVGGGSQEREVKEQVVRLGIQNQVKFTGRIPYQEVKELYLTHDALIFSSLRDSSGAQLLEAMAYGLPIVTLDHQGAHDLVPDNAGMKVPLTTVDETVDNMRQALVYLAGHPAERREMGHNGYLFALQQQWPVKIAQMLQEYHKLAGHARETV
ncbi:glycosyltransferase family 4 protein [Pontibacter sp. CAU 1760]